MDQVICIDNPNSQPTPKVKTRSVSTNRDYVCPCGKSYLSYPALFTHIKQKHNGQAPGTIIKPDNGNQNKRGRPRLMKNFTTIHNEKINQPQTVLTQLSQYVQKWSEIRTVSILRQHYEKTDFYLSFEKYKQNQVIQKKQLTGHQNQKLNCKTTLFYFLQQIQSHQLLNFFFEQFIIITILLIRGISEHTEGIQQDPNIMVEFSNDFILKYAESYVKENGLEDNQIFKLKSIMTIIQYIFKWLFYSNYTNRWIKINPQFLKYV